MGVIPNTLSLSNVISITEELAPIPAPRPSFNQALFIGTSSVIPSVGSNARIRQYDQNFETEMVADGFLTTDPEYIAAKLYFSASPAPDYVWIGRQDLTALGTLAPNASADGTGYVVGDIVTVTQSGASDGTAQVTAVGTGGTVTTLAPVLGSSGTGYSTGTALATTGGTGTGLEVDITAVGETVAEALQVCRQVNYQWYVAYAIGVAQADHEACALYIESASPHSIYFYLTEDAAVPAGTAGNIFDYLKGLSYSRSIGQYATDQSGTYPNNAYAPAAILGYAMGQNTGSANSAYTLAFKGEVGVAVEPLSVTEVNTIFGNNGNAYLSYGNYYKWFMQGTMANGQFFDEILNLDMLFSDMQYNCADLLNSNPKIPLTDPGVTQLMHQINLACEAAVTRGFLAPGIWEGLPVLNLNTGDPVPKGYITQAPPVSTLTQAQRAARQSVPIYVCITEAGAIHSVAITLYVTR